MKYFACILLITLFVFSCSSEDDSDAQKEENVIVNFSQMSSSDSENQGGNLPYLLLSGIVSSETSVVVSISESSTASGNGIDFSFSSQETIVIPAGTYDGTINSAIQLEGFIIIDDTLEEGFETIELTLSNAKGDAVLGNQIKTTYTIIDNESTSIRFSQASGTDKENSGGNLPVLLVLGVIEANASVKVSNTGNGNAVLGEDYTLDTSEQLKIPEGTYDGTLNSAIPISGLTIIDDTLIENSETFELELSEPTNGIQINSQATTVYEIEGASFCENEMAGIYPCNGYDLIGSISLADFGAVSGNDSWGWTDSTTGKEYALMGLDNGTAFVNISGDDPIYLGKLPFSGAPSSWRDIKVYKDHAFIVSEAFGSGMQVFDLTKLRDAVNLPMTFEADVLYTGFGNAHNIVINEDTGFAYVVGTARDDDYRGGAHFINIQDPKNPIAAGGYAENGYSHDAQVVTYNGPDTEYTGKEIYIGANEDQVIIADVTDKANPRSISSVTYPNIEYTHQGWFTEDQHYFLLGDELDETRLGFQSRTLIFDFSDLDNPIQHDTYLGTTSAIDHNGYVKGNDFFLANYTAGMRVLDISGVANKSISESGFFDTHPATDNPQFSGVWNVYPYFESGKIVVSDINSGLFIIRKSN